jgi:hypothetical protein
MRRALVTAAVVGAAVACLLDDRPFQPTPCSRDSECDRLYACVQTASGSRQCEARYPYGTQDAGVPAGPPRYYCTDAKPLLDRYCVDCHGPVVNLGPLHLRLDVYESDGGGPGARLAAPYLRRPVASGSMPPPVLDAGDGDGGRAFPTEEERRTLLEWIDVGAPFCAPDAGDGGG